jgi:uncharacterized protein YjdB
LVTHSTSFSPGQSKEIKISVKDDAYALPGIGTVGKMSSLTFTAEAKMTADDPATPVTVTGIELSETHITLNPDTSKKIEAIVKPAGATNKNVTWRTSDSAVAAVDVNGNVTGKAAGSAVITARTENGGFEATCEVTVVAAGTPIPPSGGGSGPDGSGGNSSSDGGGGGGCNAGFLGMTLLLAAVALKKR